jgi:hypothetical protein
MTSQGTAHGRFQRAIKSGHLLNAEMAARELGALSNSDALALVLLYQREGSEKFERAARRWVRRVQIDHRLRHQEVELLRGAWARSDRGSSRSRSVRSSEPVRACDYRRRRLRNSLRVRLRRTLVAGAVIALAVSLAVALARPGGARVGGSACGHERWEVKTLSDVRRRLVYLRPKATTVAAINARRRPNPTPRLRSRGFERRVWQVTAQIVEYKLEEDNDIHMILFDDGAYMIAEMPSPTCLPRTTRDRRAIVAVRRTFEARCGAATGGWRSLGAVARISGVGFWDFPHGQRGHARNYSELHPLTRLSLIAGCA